MISYIVSTFEKPKHLLCLLASLAVQTYQDAEIIVCDNSNSPEMSLSNRQVVALFAGGWGLNARYLDTSKRVGGQTCYHGLEVEPKGEWLCFPSDDGYHVPMFAELMMQRSGKPGLIYCDVVYDPRLALCTVGKQEYSVMNTFPDLGKFEKTCFIIHRDWFKEIGGWQPHPLDWQDGALIRAAVEAGVPITKVNGPMVVHN